MLGEDGKILKSRSGAPVKLMALLEEAVDRARAVIDASRPELSDEERAVTARQVGIGAVKYADLSTGHDTEYVFDFDRMLALSGNTGPYVQYAAARIRSILRKAGVLEQFTDGGGAAAAAHSAGHRPPRRGPRRRSPSSNPPNARSPCTCWNSTPTLNKVRDTLEPHRLCGYLFELAQLFTSFYDQCPVLKAEESVRDSRLALCALVLRRLSGGLDLLGIETPENM